jgi:ketosteroid isomerase-like protein
MMSIYAPEFVSFDIVPPLKCVGANAYKTVWEKTFSLYQPPIEIEMSDLSITAGDGLAFSRQLLRLSAMMTDGKMVDRWERLTFCFEKFDDKWLLVHEHVSVPTDLDSGRAVLDLKP